MQFRLLSLFSLSLYVIYLMIYLCVGTFTCYCFLVAYICFVWLSRVVGDAFRDTVGFGVAVALSLVTCSVSTGLPWARPAVCSFEAFLYVVASPVSFDCHFYFSI